MKSLLVVLLITVTLGAFAQNPGSVKLCGSLGFAQPVQSTGVGGILLAIEPKVIVTPNIDIGILVETTRLTRSVKFNGGTYTTPGGYLNSYKLTGNYWFSKGRFRSFAGIGAGLYQLPETGRVTVIYNQSPDDILFPTGVRFGGMIRYGLKWGHYVATVEYNQALASTLYRSATPISSQNSYLAIKIGYEVGGFKPKAASKTGK